MQPAHEPRIFFADDDRVGAAMPSPRNGHNVAGWFLHEVDCEYCHRRSVHLVAPAERWDDWRINCGSFLGTMAEARDAAERRDELEGKTEDEKRARASRSPLQFQTISELMAWVAARGPRRFLARGVWPAGDYGVAAAPAKAQKSWDTADFAVSVAAGAPLFGAIPVDDAGPVLMFLGEGGEPNILRRLQATAEAKSVDLSSLPIVVCARAPKLSDSAHLALLAAKLCELQPRLVCIDPLYLAAGGGANHASLYEMGALLEAPQHLCADVGAALLVTTHFNRKEGKGAGRILGAGPAEWGRVLIAAEVIASSTDRATGASDVLRELSIVGGEIPDRTLRVRRRIWSDDPDRLDSPLHLEVTCEDVSTAASAASDALSPAAVKLIEALEACGPSTSSALVDWIHQHHGHGLKRETVSRSLNDLERRGRVTQEPAGQFAPKTWRLAE